MDCRYLGFRHDPRLQSSNVIVFLSAFIQDPGAKTKDCFGSVFTTVPSQCTEYDIVLIFSFLLFFCCFHGFVPFCFSHCLNNMKKQFKWKIMHRYYKTNVENDVGFILTLSIFSLLKKIQSYLCLSIIMHKQQLVPGCEELFYFLSAFPIRMTRPLFCNLKISINK